METELYKIRSLGGCIKAAYDMLSSNLKTIFRRTWLPALIYAIFGGIAITHYFDFAYSAPSSPASYSLTPNYVVLALTIVFSLLALAANVWFETIIISLLSGRSVKKNLPRVVRLALLVIATTLVVGIIATVASLIPLISSGKAISPQALTLSTIISLAIYLIFIIALIPTLYSAMKYLMEPEQRIMSVFGKPYVHGWRHWGYLFMLCLLAGIIISIIYFIINMPATITAIATVSDATGKVLGDASGLPSYFKFLSILASLLSLFIMIYIGSWFTMIQYYAYGHISTKEKARLEKKNAVAESENNNVEPDFEEVK